MFGEDPKVVLTSSSLPPEILEKLHSEDDLLLLHQAPPLPPLNPHLFRTTRHLQPSMNNCHLHLLPPTSLLQAPISDPLPPSPPATHQPSTSSQAPAVQHHDNPSPLDSTPLNKRLQDITNQQKRAHQSQLSQPERMVKCSRINLKAGECGDNVAVPIPMVDKGRGEPRNILGVIVHWNEHDMNRVDCSES